MSEFTPIYTEKTAKGVRISFTTESGIEAGHAYIFFITNDLHDKPYALLEDLCVIESVRSQGVGSALLTEAIAVARKHECYKILATSRTERDRIHAWYERKGFQKYGYEFRMNLI